MPTTDDQLWRDRPATCRRIASDHCLTGYLVFAVTVLGWVVMVILLAGCPSKVGPDGPLGKLDANNATGAALAGAAREHVDAALPYTQAQGKPLLEWTQVALDRVKAIFVGNERLVAQERSERIAAQAELDKAKATWGYRLWAWCQRTWFWIKVALWSIVIGGAILQLISARVGGAIGTLAWLGFKGLIAVASGGVSLAIAAVHAFLDRLLNWIWPPTTTTETPANAPA